jgi:hypothetical protein
MSATINAQSSRPQPLPDGLFVMKIKR